MEVAENEKFKLYPYRWVMQAMLVFGFGTSGFMMIGFSPIAPIIAKLYGCSLVVVDI